MKRIAILIAVIVAILLVPLIAMQFSDQVNWTLSDFAIAGLLLLATGVLIDQVIGRTSKGLGRSIAIMFILLGFLLIWMELAVGIFATPISGS